MTTLPATEPRRSTGRLFLALGLACPALGILAYVVQLKMQHLTAPRYLPFTGIVGVLLVVAALWQRRSVWRVLALLLVLLLAGAEGAFLLASRAPAYIGPGAKDQSFPAFATVRADGTPFTQRDLEGDQDNVLVSFRGRW